jgi:hypothetical protein
MGTKEATLNWMKMGMAVSWAKSQDLPPKWMVFANGKAAMDDAEESCMALYVVGTW